MNVVLPIALGAEGAAEKGKRISEIVYDAALSLGGTFSAEHGIGQAKINLLESKRCEIEIDLMRRIKAALDASSMFNPDRVFRQSRSERAHVK